MTQIYENDNERNIHENAIHGLAEYYHLDESWLRGVYQQELRILQKHARVRAFLSVLSCHQVHDILRNMPHEQLAQHTIPSPHSD